MEGALMSSGFAGDRTEGALWERIFNQLVVNQAKSRGKEGRFFGRHFFDIFHERLGILFSKLFEEELDFHV